MRSSVVVHNATGQVLGKFLRTLPNMLHEYRHDKSGTIRTIPARITTIRTTQ